MLFLLSTALAVASIFLPTTNALMSCKNTVNGVTYDLTPLHALGDISVTPATGGYDYYINVCGAVQGPCAAHPSAFLCQVRKFPANQFESVNAYSDIENHTPEPIWGPSASATGGVKLVFTNGDSCNLRQRIFNADFQCDMSGSRAITIDENPACTFNMIFPTPVVCPGYVPPTPTTAAPTTRVPTTAAPTTQAPTTAAPTVIPTHVPTSTPTSSPSSNDDIIITRAGINIGIGIGVGIGVGCMAISWLIWCCWDRYRTQRQVQMGNGNGNGYVPLASI